MIVVIALLLLAQVQEFTPIVTPDMIEISFDGISFQDATVYVFNITISTGIAAGEHITHIRRGDIMNWEAQLGGSYKTEKVEWQLDTSLIPKDNNKMYLRLCYGFEDPHNSGKYVLSPVSDISNVVKLIGKPTKPTHVE